VSGGGRAVAPDAVRSLSEDMSRSEVQAAGGVVVRTDGRLAVVHRPKYDDWSLPKGKLDPGESFEDAAVREVEEETGLRCRLRDELEPMSYADRKGRAKVVRWWRMEIVAERPFRADNEVDALVWWTVGEAAVRLTYARDRALLAGMAVPAVPAGA